MGPMPTAIRMHSLIQFQRPLIPAFSFGGTARTPRNYSKLVASPGCTCDISPLLFKRQALTVASLGVSPFFLLLCNSTKLMPYNSLFCWLTQSLEVFKCSSVARSRLVIVPLLQCKTTELSQIYSLISQIPHLFIYLQSFLIGFPCLYILTLV